MTKLIDSIRRGVPAGLEEIAQLGRTLWRRRHDILAFFDHYASNGPTEASAPASPATEQASEGEAKHAPGVAQTAAEPHASHPVPPKLEVEPVDNDKKSRSNQFRLARLGIIATMVVGLGTMVVGVVGSGVTWYAGKQHDEQETVRAQMSFMHSQQVEAYTAFDSAIDDFDDSFHIEAMKYYTVPAPQLRIQDRSPASSSPTYSPARRCALTQQPSAIAPAPLDEPER